MRIRRTGRSIPWLLPFLLINLLILGILGYRWGGAFAKTARTDIALKFYNSVLRLYVPQLADADKVEESACYQDLLTAFLPVFSCSEEQIRYETGMEEQMKYENLAVQENTDIVHMLEENETKVAGNDAKVPDNELNDAKNEEIQKTQEENEKAEVQQTVSAGEKLVTYSIDQMRDFDYLRQTFYQIDSSTTTNSDQLNVDKLLAENVTADKQAAGPQILIYHTHSLEAYADSAPGDVSQTVVGVGDYLTSLLTQQYGWSVLHHRETYDTDRDYAYSCAAPALQQLMDDNPSIQVVIDLHRDGIAETTHLVTEQNGKQMAKIMFFNGLCYSTSTGTLASYPNPYLDQNLALSFQMQLAANEYYPDFTRRIYLKAWRYNMHFCPKSMLIEVGAQTNTLEEAMNAMEPLADILDKVLTGTARQG